MLCHQFRERLLGEPYYTPVTIHCAHAHDLRASLRCLIFPPVNKPSGPLRRKVIKNN